MESVVSEKIKSVFESQKAFFATNQTKDLAFRKKQLGNLKASLIKHKDAIIEALADDLGKSRMESEMVEFKGVVSEIDIVIDKFEKWAEVLDGPSMDHPAGGKLTSKITYAPYGVSYIIGPFNYPIILNFSPLIASLIAGNTAIIKPSENTPKTSKVIEDIVNDAFESNYVSVIQGAVEENTLLLSLPFDYIFFTGSVNVGKIVMEAAAKQLIPLTLELGGKSPTIICEDADLDKAVARIAFGKLINCGQTCVAPDYFYVHESVKDQFVDKFKAYLKAQYNDETLGKIGKIVTKKQVENLAGYIEKSKDKLVYGGKYDIDNRYFEATILDNVTWDDAVMQQEIFGPILPIMTYSDLNQVIDKINSEPKPFAHLQ